MTGWLVAWPIESNMFISMVSTQTYVMLHVESNKAQFLDRNFSFYILMTYVMYQIY
ncbi:hypothetical protein HOLleu_34991 [Holothuria leucospilota]|uniref:Uncharacterized protein n=1 Tax=Holothuria leucospilota TaxID=206669 RepID=A0A9Q0YP45_HOLLE|nr:hypothetical protein HOLleu_34991 [Holothuria leucospilota]